MGLCFQANPVLFDSINRWVIYSRPLRSLDLSRHRPVVDGPGPTWARVGRAPFKRLDELCEGEPLFATLALIAAPLLIFNLVAAVVFHKSWTQGTMWEIAPAVVGWGVLATGLFLAIRSFLLAWRYHRVSMGQMGKIHEWMVSYPGVGSAAAEWMRPGLVLHQGDFRAIRRAVNLERRRLGVPLLARDSSAPPVWFSRCADWFFNRSLAATARTAALASQLGQPGVLWDEALRDNKKWVVDNALAVPAAPSPGASLTPSDQQRVQVLARRRSGLEEGSRPTSEDVKDTWGRLIHHPAATSSLQSMEGRSLMRGWLATSLWSAAKKSMLLMLVLGVVGQVAAMQVTALELPAPGEASDALGNVVVMVVHFLARMQDYSLRVGASVAGFVMLIRLPLLIPFWTLRKVWWRLPLSPAGRAGLDEVVSRLPVLRASFLVMGKDGLTQADLDFARQAAKALRHVVRHQETMEDVERRAQALETLPAMAEYRARQLANQLSLSLAEPSPARPKPRL